MAISATYLEPDVSGSSFTRSPVAYDYLSNSSDGNNAITLKIYSWNGTGSYAFAGDPISTLVKPKKILGDAFFDVSDFIRSEMLIDVSPDTIPAQNFLVEAHDGEAVVGVTSSIAFALNGYTDFQDGFNSTGSKDIYTSCVSAVTSSTGFSGDPTILNYLPENSHMELTCLRSEYTALQVYVQASGSTKMDSGFGVNITAPTKPSTTDNTLFTWDCGLAEIETYVGYQPDSYDVRFMSGSEFKALYKFKKTFGCYDYTTIQFMNRYGVYDFLHFRGRSKDSSKLESEEFNRNVIYQGGRFDPTPEVRSYQGQKGVLWKTGVDGFSANTGWIPEHANDRIKELMLSEYVWEYDTQKPLFITDKQISYKNTEYDKVISYDVKFDYAFNIVNDIR